MLSYIVLLKGDEKVVFEVKVDEILQGDVIKDVQGCIEVYGLIYFVWIVKW